MTLHYSDIIDFSIRLATESLEAGEVAHYQSIVKDLSTKHSDDIRVLRFIFQSLIGSSDFDKAIDLSKVIFSKIPDDFETNLGLARIYTHQEQLEKAVVILDRMGEQSIHPKQLIELCRMQMSLNDFDAMRKNLSRLIDNYQYFDGTHDLLCSYHSQLKDYPSALLALEVEVEANGFNMSRLCTFVEIYVSLRDKEKLALYVHDLDLLAQKLSYGRIILANGHVALGDFKNAQREIESFNAAIEKLPSFFVSKIISVYTQLGFYEKAIYILSDFLEKKPGDFLMVIALIELCLKHRPELAKQTIQDMKTQYFDNKKKTDIKDFDPIESKFIDFECFQMIGEGRCMEAFNFWFSYCKKQAQLPENMLEIGESVKGKKILVHYQSYNVESVKLMHVLVEQGAHVFIYAPRHIHEQSSGLLEAFESVDQRIPMKDALKIKQIDAWLPHICLPAIVIPEMKSLQEVSSHQMVKKNELKVVLAIIHNAEIDFKDFFLEDQIELMTAHFSSLEHIILYTYTNFPLKIDHTVDVLITNQVNLAKYAAYMGLQVFLFVGSKDFFVFPGDKDTDIWFDNLHLLRQDEDKRINAYIGWSSKITSLYERFGSIVSNFGIQ